MSRRRFYRGTLEIVAGWDKRGGHFVLDIFDYAPRKDLIEERIVYSSLCEIHDVYVNFTIPDIVDTLERQAIVAPVSFMNDLRADAQANVGNLQVTYTEVV